MMTVIDANLLILIIALVVGFIIGWWMFKRHRSANSGRVSTEARPAQPQVETPPVRPYMQKRPIRDGIDTVEGRGIADEGASAFEDVAGEVLGVSAQRDVPSSTRPSDNLQTLKGVGPKLAQKLNENGITTFEQLANLSATEVAILDEKLGAFRGRLQRDRVVEQASYLARGDREGFEARFGSLGGS